MIGNNTGCPRTIYTQKCKILRFFITMKIIKLGELFYLSSSPVLLAFWRILNQGNQQNTRRCSNYESRLLSRSHTFAIIVILDLKIYQSMWLHWPFFFSKNLNQRSLTPRWPLTPCLLRSHVWLYPRIMCPSPMTIHQCMWIQWSILQNTTYILHTYYVQNEWSHTCSLFSVQARQKLKIHVIM